MNRDYIEAEQGVPGAAGSVWLASNAEEYPTLDGDQTADVVVVGGGITGALVARKLSGDGTTRLAGGGTDRGGRALREDRILAEVLGPEYVTYRDKAGSCRRRQKTSPTQIPRALRTA